MSTTSAPCARATGSTTRCNASRSTPCREEEEGGGVVDIGEKAKKNAGPGWGPRDSRKPPNWAAETTPHEGANQAPSSEVLRCLRRYESRAIRSPGAGA